jgi:serine/threonine protein kinase
MKMEFNSPLDVFSHLLEKNEFDLNNLLDELMHPSNPFYQSTKKLIEAHNSNHKNEKIHNLLLSQAEYLINDTSIHQLLHKQVGQYKLTKKLGSGGMGVVYLAERNDGKLQQKVSIKFIYPSIDCVTSKSFILNEAQHLANLQHPNIARVNTVDSTDEDIHYIVMEYIQGLPIDQHCLDNNLTLKQMLVLFQKLCGAVLYMHEKKVVHADIKACNVLVNQCGEPKVIDFGITENFSSTPSSIKSHHYLSTEQLKNKNISSLYDIYALGCLLKKLSIPYSNSLNVKELNAIIAKASNKNESLRYNGVTDLNNDLFNFINNNPVNAFSISKVYHLKKILQKNQLYSSISLVLLSIFSIVWINV